MYDQIVHGAEAISTIRDIDAEMLRVVFLQGFDDVELEFLNDKWWLKHNFMTRETESLKT